MFRPIIQYASTRTMQTIFLYNYLDSITNGKDVL